MSLSENVGYDAIVGALNRQIDGEINWDEVNDLRTVGIDGNRLAPFAQELRSHQHGTSAQWQGPGAGGAPRPKKTTVRAFLDQIPARLRSTIRSFTTDMWEGYMNAVEEYIKAYEDVTAYLVVDRFHVAQHYRDEFDSLRKVELKRRKQELPEETYKQECKGMLWTLRKNHEDLDDDERKRLRQLFRHAPALHRAYSL